LLLLRRPLDSVEHLAADDLGDCRAGQTLTVLIVNADDLGCAVSATDAILTCHREGAITSATAMVYMEDSDRAARLAVDQRLPVGLHINLTTPFTDRSVPYTVRERQARMIDTPRALTGTQMAL
jgi:YdjC-like protein